MRARWVGTEQAYSPARRAGWKTGAASAAFAVASFASGALVGLLAALVAVAVGVVGVLLSLAPGMTVGRGVCAARAGAVTVASLAVVTALYRLVE